MRLIAISSASLLCALLSACGGTGGGSAASSVPPLTYFYVDAQNGSDAGDGSPAAPFKTLTFTVATVGPGADIKVLPGDYDAANGETFPIQLQDGQTLEGDVQDRGLGAIPTRVIGEGAMLYGWSATIALADQNKVSGLNVHGTTHLLMHAAFHIDSHPGEIAHNTVSAPTYAGIYARYADGSDVHDNDLNSNSYGIYIQHSLGLGTAVYARNTIPDAVFPFDINAAGNLVEISDSTITGSGMVGIQVQSGTPQIVGNTFNAPGGYSYGAIHTSGVSATPRIRGNIFICKLAILVDNGTADLGTASDPGNNDFSQVTSTALEHASVAALSAIGNTWPNTPPVNGSDIVISGSGTVTWGTGPGETY